ncbi:MAG: DNA polymerase III subunit epsilon [Rhizobiaceae bacterium]|nr:DNA polymerase III subunit epsilon [Rhizobiaceae bacterium]MCV0404670.1 DNA polymerase III subunit epsilon [Rhizobiaceae bacterium]
MREIIFDTETTGLDPREDRVIELGGVELHNRFPTGRTFHTFINPQGRPVHPEALAVHGISDDQLRDKPTFAEIGPQWLDFVGDARLVAHNAGFDMSFLDAEFTRIGLACFDAARVVDTLQIARRKHPMGPNSLDALCKRYGISNAHRTKHGALLDSELLAEVYIELAGGRQAALVLETREATVEVSDSGARIEVVTTRTRTRPLAPRLSDAERAAHGALVSRLGEGALWRRTVHYAETSEAAGD